MKPALKTIIPAILILFSHLGMAFCNQPQSSSLTVDQILEKIEKKYSGTGFSVSFDQESTLKAMQITDTASGKAFFKHPNMMRWEYEKPTRQLIITDGTSLWIFKPEENQVMLGKSPSFFGDGKGASFLTDIQSIRKKFKVRIEKADGGPNLILRLIPENTDLDLSYILLTVSKITYTINQISTYNSYEDETKIIFKEVKFSKESDNKMFKFKIPKDADILSYEE